MCTDRQTYTCTNRHIYLYVHVAIVAKAINKSLALPVSSYVVVRFTLSPPSPSPYLAGVLMAPLHICSAEQMSMSLTEALVHHPLHALMNCSCACVCVYMVKYVGAIWLYLQPTPLAHFQLARFLVHLG